MKTLIPVLESFNRHERDKWITLDVESHIYTITHEGKNGQIEEIYDSVTSCIKKHVDQFDPDKVIPKMKSNPKKWTSKHRYWGKTDEEIKKLWETDGKEASSLGTQLHNNIEWFMNDIALLNEKQGSYTHEDLAQRHLEHLIEDGPEEFESTIEWCNFLRFLTATPFLAPFRTEWRIYDRQYKVAGSIDMLYRDISSKEPRFLLIDWKRSKEISKDNKYRKPKILGNVPDTKFWKYAIQLNFYKYILEKNYDIKVSEMWLIRLHPNCNTYERIDVPDMKETIETILRLK